jgi:hypothetical protein
MNIIFPILAFSNADLLSECIDDFDRSHMVFSMHIILGSVKLNLKLHTRKSKHTHTKCANWQGGVCLRIYHKIRIKVNTYYQCTYYIYIFTIMNLASGVLHIIHHSSVQGESTPNLL